ncbi:ATP-binding protein [Candidatus Pacearchaeota archaeon]|nr:ATP-binding protein [Candidatus Pacearchaeota archaeon]
MTLEKLVQEKEFAFTVDVGKMIEKLKKYQSVERYMYIPELIRSAVKAGATEIRVKNNGSTFSVEHDGVGMSEEEINRIFTEIFSSEEEKKFEVKEGAEALFEGKKCKIRGTNHDPGNGRPTANIEFEGGSRFVYADELQPPKEMASDPYKRLGISVISALSQNPERIEIETTKNGKNINAVIDDKTNEISFYEGFRQKGTKITIKRKGSRFGLLGRKGESERILNDCEYVPVPLFLNWGRVNKPLGVKRQLYSYTFDRDGARGCISLLKGRKGKKNNEKKGSVLFLKNGVEICEKNNVLGGEGTQGIIDCDSFNMVLSGNQIIEDDAYKRAVNILREETNKFTIELIAKTGNIMNQHNEEIREYLLSFLGFNLRSGTKTTIWGINFGYNAYDYTEMGRIKESPIGNIKIFPTIEGEKISLYEMYEAYRKGNLYKNHKPMKRENEDRLKGLVVLLAEENSYTEGVLKALFSDTSNYYNFIQTRSSSRLAKIQEEKKMVMDEKEAQRQLRKKIRKERIGRVYNALSNAFSVTLSPVVEYTWKATRATGREIGKGIKFGAGFIYEKGLVTLTNFLQKNEEANRQENSDNLVHVIDSQRGYDADRAEPLPRLREREFSLPSLKGLFYISPETRKAIKNAASSLGSGVKTAGFYSKEAVRIGANIVWLPVKYTGLGIAAGLCATGAGGVAIVKGAGKAAGFVGEKTARAMDIGLDYGMVPLNAVKESGLLKKIREDFGSLGDGIRERKKTRRESRKIEKLLAKEKIKENEANFIKEINRFFDVYGKKRYFTLGADDKTGRLCYESGGSLFLNRENPYVQDSLVRFSEDKSSIEFFIPLLTREKEVIEHNERGAYFSEHLRAKERLQILAGLTSDVYQKSHPFGIYHSSTELFKKIFPAISEKEQKEVIGYIFSREAANRNAEADKWLSENYAGLVEEVGMIFVGKDAERKERARQVERIPLRNDDSEFLRHTDRTVNKAYRDFKVDAGLINDSNINEYIIDKYKE